MVKHRDYLFPGSAQHQGAEARSRLGRALEEGLRRHEVRVAEFIGDEPRQLVALTDRWPG